MKSKEALRQLKKHLCFNTEQEHHENLYFYEMVEKELKAFEIIKNKNVNIYKIRICENVKEYNELKNTGSELAEDEFNLLKEALK